MITVHLRVQLAQFFEGIFDYLENHGGQEVVEYEGPVPMIRDLNRRIEQFQLQKFKFIALFILGESWVFVELELASNSYRCPSECGAFLLQIDFFCSGVFCTVMPATSC